MYGTHCTEILLLRMNPQSSSVIAAVLVTALAVPTIYGYYMRSQARKPTNPADVILILAGQVSALYFPCFVCRM